MYANVSGNKDASSILEKAHPEIHMPYRTTFAAINTRPQNSAVCLATDVLTMLQG